MKFWIAVLLMVPSVAMAQFTPSARAAYVYSAGSWAPLAGAGAAIGPPNPQPIALYVRSGGSWVAWDGSSSGGGAPSGPAGGDLGGTYPNPTVVGAHIVSGSAAFTGQSSVTSSTVTTTPTFVVSDTEPAATTMIAAAVYGPNMVNNDNLYLILGKSNTASNAYYIRYSQLSTGNYMSFQAAGQPTQFAMFATGNSAFGNTFTDSGYKLDVLGSFRASQVVGGGSAPTIAAGTGAGTSPTIAVTGTSSAFTVNLTSGTTSASSAVIATVTFATAYGSAPRIVCQAKNAATAAFTTSFYATTTTTTAVLNSGTTALTDATAYSWDCHVIQ